MKVNKLSEHYIRSFKQDIVNLLDDYQLDEYHTDIFDIVTADLLMTSFDFLSAFEKFNNDYETLEVKLMSILASRWYRIANKPICYSRNAELPMSLVCINLANELGKTPEDISILLMPSVHPTDCYYNNFHELECGKYMITDDCKNFIDLESFIDAVIERAQLSEETVFKYFDATSNAVKDFSEFEINRLQAFCPSLMATLETIRSKYSARRINFYVELSKLRNGLVKGDVSHRGKELDAGSPANIAAAEFYQYWERLPERKKKSYRDITGGGTTLGTILDRVFKPEEVARRDENPVNQCVQIIGGMLESFLANSDVKAALNVETTVNPSKLLHLKSKLMDELNHKVVLIKPAHMAESRRYFDLTKLLKINIEHELNSLPKKYELNEQDNMFIELGVAVSKFFDEFSRNSKLFNKCISLYIAINREASRFMTLSPEEKNLQIREIFLRTYFLYNFSDFLTLPFFTSCKFSTELTEFAKKHSEFLRKMCHLEVDDNGLIKYTTSFRKEVAARIRDRVISSPELHEHQDTKHNQNSRL